MSPKSHSFWCSEMRTGTQTLHSGALSMPYYLPFPRGQTESPDHTKVTCVLRPCVSVIAKGSEGPVPTRSVLQHPARWLQLFSGAKLDSMVKNHICLEIWDHSLSRSPHLPTPAFGENCSKSYHPPLQMRKLENRWGPKPSGGNRTTCSWRVKGLPLNHANHCFLRKLNLSYFKCLLLQKPFFQRPHNC